LTYLDGTLNFVDRGREHNLVELSNHLTRTEFTERAAGLSRRAGGVLLGEVGEGGTAFNFSHELFALGFVLDEDVAGAGLLGVDDDDGEEECEDAEFHHGVG
jgi:hypothetical protein